MWSMYIIHFVGSQSLDVSSFDPLRWSRAGLTLDGAHFGNLFCFVSLDPVW